MPIDSVQNYLFYQTFLQLAYIFVGLVSLAMAVVAFKLLKDTNYVFFGLMGLNDIMVKHGLFAIMTHRLRHH